MVTVRRLIAAFETLLLCGLILAGVAMRFDLAGKTIDFDAGLFAYTTQRVANDITEITSYTEFFDNMPPLIYEIYGLSFRLFGQTPLAVHMTSVLPDLLILLLIVLLGRAWISLRAGLWAAALYAVSYVPLRLSHFGQAENAAMAAALLGLLLYTSGAVSDPGRRRLKLFLAGVCFGIGAMIKQPVAFLLLGLVLHLVLTHLRPLRLLARAATHLGWILAGFCALLAVVGLALTWRGILIEAVNACLWFPLRFQGVYGMSNAEKWREFVEKAALLLPFWGVLAAAGTIRALALRERGLLLAALCLLCACGFYVWTGDFFQHYILYALPAAALLAGGALDYALTARRALWIRLPLAVVVAALALHQYELNRRARYGFGMPDDERTANLSYYYHHDNALAYQLDIAACIDNRLGPDDLLFTTTPTFAFLLDRRNHYSQFYVAPLTRTASRGFADLDQYLEESRVVALELGRLDFLPEQIVNQLADQWIELRCPTSSGSPDSMLVYENPRPPGVSGDTH